MANANRVTRGTQSLNVELLTPAGSVQADALAIPIKSSPALIVVQGDGVTGVRLPLTTKGAIFYVKNTGAVNNGFMGILNVYPGSGVAINALAVNSPLQMAALTSTIFISASKTQWYTIPLLPS